MDKISYNTAIQLIGNIMRNTKDDMKGMNSIMDLSTLEIWIKKGYIKDYEYTGEK